jgi:hypothetical protein
VLNCYSTFGLGPVHGAFVRQPKAFSLRREEWLGSRETQPCPNEIPFFDAGKQTFASASHR